MYYVSTNKLPGIDQCAMGRDEIMNQIFVFIKPQIDEQEGERIYEFDVPIKIAITNDRCSEKAPFFSSSFLQNQTVSE